MATAAKMAQTSGSTGGSTQDPKDEEIAKLKQMIFMMNAKLHADMNPEAQFAREAEREAEREAARAAVREAAREATREVMQAAAKAPVKEASEPEDERVGLQAARQRLRRMCAPRANGSLAVPKEVHEKYVAGGSDREGLLKLLIKNNFDKDADDLY